MLRHEKILCLNYNTIRINDTLIQKVIDDTLHIAEPYLKYIYKSITRNDVIIDKEYGVSKETYENLKKSLYISKYTDAPYSKLFTTIIKLKETKFIDSIDLLYDKILIGSTDMKTIEKNFNSLLYDGSISNLEKIINENNYTALIVDNIDIVINLITNNKINLNGFSFIISKLGYNFIKTKDNKYDMKNSDIINNAQLLYDFDLAFIDLWKFTKSELEEIQANG